MMALRRLLLPCAALALLALATPAAPTAAHSGPDLGCEANHIPYLGRSCLRADGLYAVQLADGLVLHTHGPDPLETAAAPGFIAGSPERPLLCAEGARMEVLYGHPQGSADRLADVADDLRAALRRANQVLAEDAVASGGPVADFKVACTDGDIRISSFTGPAGGSAAYTAEYAGIVNAARAAGFTAGETDYLIFWDASSTVCGVGNLYGDTSLSPQNDNMVQTGYGVVYDGCWFGRTPMHENGHNQGAVQDLAPNWDGSGHCLEGRDVMCYPGENGVLGTATLGLVRQCADRIHYDCGFDTYFDAAPEAGEWLASNWNIGHPVNRYLAFGGNLTGEPAPAPSASPSSTSAPSPSPSPSASASASPSGAPRPSPSASPSTSRTSSVVLAPNALNGTGAASDGGAGPSRSLAAPGPAVAAAGLVAALAFATRRRL